MNTLLLDQEDWDLCLDSSANIALASNPYSLAQDAASAIKMWKGEFWYDTTQGVAYLTDVLAVMPIPLTLIKGDFEEAALTVPEVTDVNVFIASIAGRTMKGQVQVMDNGTVLVATDFTT